MRLTIERACEEAGARIADSAISLTRSHPVGTTIATGTMEVVAQRHGTDILVRALKMLVAAERGPIKAQEIAAAVLVLTRSKVDDRLEKRLVEVIASKSAIIWSAEATISSSGTSRAEALAAAWSRAIDQPFGPPTRAERETPAAIRRRLEAEEAADAVPEPPAPEPPPPLPERAPEPPAAIEHRTVARNGVAVDLTAGTVSHRGGTVLVPYAAELVAALVRVMPELMDHRRLAVGLFGNHDLAGARLRDVIAEVSLPLCSIRLQIKTIKGIGHSLYDLGPDGVESSRESR